MPYQRPAASPHGEWRRPAQGGSSAKPVAAALMDGHTRRAPSIAQTPQSPRQGPWVGRRPLSLRKTGRHKAIGELREEQQMEGLGAAARVTACQLQPCCATRLELRVHPGGGFLHDCALSTGLAACLLGWLVPSHPATPGEYLRERSRSLSLLPHRRRRPSPPSAYINALGHRIHWAGARHLRCPAPKEPLDSGPPDRNGPVAAARQAATPTKPDPRRPSPSANRQTSLPRGTKLSAASTASPCRRHGPPPDDVNRSRAISVRAWDSDRETTSAGPPPAVIAATGSKNTPAETQ